MIPPVYPNGWFVLCESDDIKKSQVRSVDALGVFSVVSGDENAKIKNYLFSVCFIGLFTGEHFAVFRTSEGAAYVLDAYCPHLGAHLGVGGRVVGDCVECPFHGWQFRGADGQCTAIPYTSGKSMELLFF